MRNLEDSYRHKGLRRQLIKILREKGITDERVLSAMGKVPRHFFFDNAFLEHAYQDKAFPIGEGQTISQPYTVAFQSEKLELFPGARVLEVGTGSGYQATILLELGADVHTIEYNQVLYERTRYFLPQIGYQAHFYLGDGSRGLPQMAPYDRIIVTAGCPSVPSELVAQLKIGGILIIPVGDNEKQRMVRIKRIDEKKLRKDEFDFFSFVPLKGKNGWSL